MYGMKAFTKIMNQEEINNKFLTRMRARYADSRENYTYYIISDNEIDNFNKDNHSGVEFKTRKQALKSINNSY